MTVRATTLGGFRDTHPTMLAVRKHLIEKIATVYRRFGFVELDTACLERLDVLFGELPPNGQFNKSVYLAQIKTGLDSVEDTSTDEEQGAQVVGLRYDLTVSLARYVAANVDQLQLPFKRYQCGKVWRGDKPQLGRMREFSQFDFDIIGVEGLMADTECIQVMYEVLKALQLDDFVILINNRKMLNGLAASFNIIEDERRKHFLQRLDSFNPDAKDAIQHLTTILTMEAASEVDFYALNLSKEQARVVIDFLVADIHTTDEALDYMAQLVGDQQEGLVELRELVANLRVLGIPERNWRIDTRVVRGLDYYTGTVFETFLTNPAVANIGSVFSGGRFDDLVSRFIPDRTLPGVGASVGVDRLIVAMQQLGYLSERETSLADVIVARFNDTWLQSAQLATALRNAGIATQFYVGDDTSLRAQLTYALALQAKFLLIIGDREIAKRVIAIKNLETRQQIEIPEAECVQYLQNALT